MKLGVIFLSVILMLSLVFAGVGIEWAEKKVIINEGNTMCMTYKLYNPWPEATEVNVEISGELSEILKSLDKSVVNVRADVSSGEGIPVEVCFEAPLVYEGDCSLDLKTYSGEVVVTGEVSGNAASATKAAVSVPLSVEVGCDPANKNYTLGYVLLAFFSILGILIFVTRRTS